MLLKIKFKICTQLSKGKKVGEIDSKRGLKKYKQNEYKAWESTSQGVFKKESTIEHNITD